MRRRLLALPFALALLGVFAQAHRAHAQIDPGNRSYGVYQHDRLVGEVFREDLDRAHYTEHWVLTADYVRPDAANGVTTTIRPSDRTYRDLGDFFARVPWSRGSHHVEAVCDDGDALPGAR